MASLRLAMKLSLQESAETPSKPSKGKKGSKGALQRPHECASRARPECCCCCCCCCCFLVSAVPHPSRRVRLLCPSPLSLSGNPTSPSKAASSQKRKRNSEGGGRRGPGKTKASSVGGGAAGDQASEKVSSGGRHDRRLASFRVALWLVTGMVHSNS